MLHDARVGHLGGDVSDGLGAMAEEELDARRIERHVARFHIGKTDTCRYTQKEQMSEGKMPKHGRPRRTGKKRHIEVGGDCKAREISFLNRFRLKIIL